MSHVERLSTVIHLEMKLQKPSTRSASYFFFFRPLTYGAKMCLSISIIGLFPYIFTPIPPLWYYIWSNGHRRTAGCILRTVKQASSVWWNCEQEKRLKWDWKCVRKTMGLGRAKGYKLTLFVCVCHRWRHLIPTLKYKHFSSFVVFLLWYQNMIFVFYWCLFLCITPFDLLGQHSQACLHNSEKATRKAL